MASNLSVVERAQVVPRVEVYAACVLIWRLRVNDLRTLTMRTAGFRVVRGGSEANRTAIRFTRRWIGVGLDAWG